MSWSDENDGEAALFQSEMESDDTRQRLRRILQNNNLRRMMKNEPHLVEINLQTLRALVKQHNEALQLLREIIEAHPESTGAMRHARVFIKDVDDRAAIDV